MVAWELPRKLDCIVRNRGDILNDDDVKYSNFSTIQYWGKLNIKRKDTKEMENVYKMKNVMYYCKCIINI